jgi:hypothetical protein
VGGTDDQEDVVAQLSVGNASFWVADESPAHGNFSPESIGGGTVRMLLIVDDPQSVLDRAVTAGATEIYPVGEEHVVELDCGATAPDRELGPDARHYARAGAMPATTPASLRRPISASVRPSTPASTSSVCSPSTGARTGDRRSAFEKSSGEAGIT